MSFANRFLSSETKKKTLEEIAAAFGEKVVLVTDQDLAIEEAIMGDKAPAEHVEMALPAAK
jgi:hypothetical protein